MSTKSTSFYLIILSILVISCSKEDELTSEEKRYITIPDIQFETKLINKGIDTDGIINQKILKTDALAMDYLDVSSGSLIR
tara:strand:+ start:33048 stop:33290 length:243 start_codon:yes stop_codon:yes gene_type:complete